MGNPRGRPPKAIALHKAEGTYRPTRHNKRAADATGAPRKPAAVRKDRVASHAWDLIVGSLPPHIFARVDALALEMACRWFSLWQQAMTAGEVNRADKASKRWEALASRLGCSPADRARLVLPPDPEEQDDLTDLLNMKAQYFAQ